MGKLTKFLPLADLGLLFTCLHVVSQSQPVHTDSLHPCWELHMYEWERNRISITTTISISPALLCKSDLKAAWCALVHKGMHSIAIPVEWPYFPVVARPTRTQHVVERRACTVQAVGADGMHAKCLRLTILSIYSVLLEFYCVPLACRGATKHTERVLRLLRPRQCI